MVKGISKQVILVQSPDPKLFDQAIFILKDGAVGISDEALLKEACEAVDAPEGKRRLWYYGPAWACAGAVVTALVWGLTLVL